MPDMDYSKVTHDEFAEAVRTVARSMGTDALLDIPGVWEVVSEELNNPALDICPSAELKPEAQTEEEDT